MLRLVFFIEIVYYDIVILIIEMILVWIEMLNNKKCKILREYIFCNSMIRVGSNLVG